MSSRPRKAAAAALVLTAMLAACGGDGGGADGTGASASPDAVTGELGEKPVVQIPEGAPPAELVIQDLVVGEGDEVKPGDTITAHYVGVSWTNGQQFDASWDRGSPATFSVGTGDLIAGWDEGIPGMRVGGRRQLIVPPDLGYGAMPPPGIEPNDTLYFVVDLVSIQ